MPNNSIKMVDTPFFQLMTPPPVAPAAGCCMQSDGVRFLYVLFSVTGFYRYDTWGDAWQQLASPPGGTFGAGTCIQYDQVKNRVWALITSGVGAPTFQYYSPVTDAWVVQSVVNLPATFGTDGDMAFPNTQVGAASSDFIYLVGNNAAVLYRFQISTNTWINTLTAAPSTSATGGRFAFAPLYGGAGDRIVRIRGGATATIDYYNITTNAWVSIAYNPDTEVFGAGSCMCKLQTGAPLPRLAIIKDATQKIFELDLSGSGIMAMLANQNAIAHGAAIVGNRMDTAVAPGGTEFLYLIPPTVTQLVRAMLIY